MSIDIDRCIKRKNNDCDYVLQEKNWSCELCGGFTFHQDKLWVYEELDQSIGPYGDVVIRAVSHRRKSACIAHLAEQIEELKSVQHGE